MERTQPADSGAASAVATLFVLLIVASVLSAAVGIYGPARMRDHEAAHGETAEAALAVMRADLLSGLLAVGPRTYVFPLGAEGVPVLADPTADSLRTDAAFRLEITTEFVYTYDSGTATARPQDAVLLIDSSGSMLWNDRRGVRKEAAREYIAQLRAPDRVAIVDFDSVSRLTRANVRGGTPHHLTHAGHSGTPDYAEAQGDVAAIDSSGGTNFASALALANRELAAYGDPAHARVEILLTDGRNGRALYDAWALVYARQARDLNITIYTIGLGNADASLLSRIATTTGGTYYRAATAEDLRWIYQEISARYAPRTACSCTTTTEGASGSLAWGLANRETAPRTLRLEGGALLAHQPDGQVMLEGPLIALVREGSGWRLEATLVTLDGTVAFRGPAPETLSLRRQGRGTSAFEEASPDLAEDRRTLEALRRDMGGWAKKGIARNGGDARSAAAMDAALGDLRAFERAPGAATADAAKRELAAAALTLRAETRARNVQGATADAAATALQRAACRLTQWEKWDGGVVITVTTASPRAWRAWFEEWLWESGAPGSANVAGEKVTVRIPRVGTIAVEHAVFLVGDSGA